MKRARKRQELKLGIAWVRRLQITMGETIDLSDRTASASHGRKGNSEHQGHSRQGLSHIHFLLTITLHHHGRDKHWGDWGLR
jgi:hypothetical protein